MRVIIKITRQPNRMGLAQRSRELARERQRFTTTLARVLAGRILMNTPVDTARARSGWAAAATDLRGQLPPGWKGPHPVPAAITTGISEGSAQVQQAEQSTTVIVENHVPYILFLEYGTSRSAPIAMVRQALRDASFFIPQMPLFGTVVER